MRVSGHGRPTSGCIVGCLFAVMRGVAEQFVHRQWSDFGDGDSISQHDAMPLLLLLFTFIPFLFVVLEVLLYKDPLKRVLCILCLILRIAWFIKAGFQESAILATYIRSYSQFKLTQVHSWMDLTRVVFWTENGNVTKFPTGESFNRCKVSYDEFSGPISVHFLRKHPCYESSKVKFLTLYTNSWLVPNS